ncbi:hypothetical protein [Photobacterium ganghwense]|uniref:hypothetical protein n=1 Tax=Photobacterium ganghwense TaxID=320778 RepID=UPI00069EF8E9|nr:hypothetical protein [Photobacterium ganghwense]MBV1839140.1 hypothetical protein [Photobacterium ganghwense]PSU10651.1 hypothetical protein C9I92_00515 [Photobacterium ganghwense]QSV12795.1 hypothetical protein FH974_08350 [Photobacterium ganghwense]
MIKLFDTWHVVVHALIPVCVFTIFFTALFKEWKIRKQVIILLFCVMLVSFFSLLFLKRMIRNELSEQLSEYSFIVGTTLEFDEKRLISALKNQIYISTNKTRPVDRTTLRIVIHSGELELWISRDSDNPNIYWIYHPKYLYSRSNEIGKIQVR